MEVPLLEVLGAEADQQHDHGNGDPENAGDQGDPHLLLDTRAFGHGRGVTGWDPAAAAAEKSVDDQGREVHDCRYAEHDQRVANADVPYLPGPENHCAPVEAFNSRYVCRGTSPTHRVQCLTPPLSPGTVQPSMLCVLHAQDMFNHEFHVQP